MHVFDAVWDERLNPYVGPGKHTIFFSVRGDRPIVDEIANSDFDSDLFWVCCNTEVSAIFTLLLLQHNWHSELLKRLIM